MRPATIAVLLALATGSRPAPEFPTADRRSWIGEPVGWRSLRGHVVLLDVWTFG